MFRRTLALFLLVFSLALGVRLLRYKHWPGGCLTPAAEANEVSRIAHTLASRGSFADPYPLPTGPTGHHAPVFPYLLSLIYRAFDPEQWLSARVALNILLASLTCAAVYLAGMALELGFMASFVTALILAMQPFAIGVEICNDQEADLVALLSVVAIGVTAAYLRGRVQPIVLGAVWGLTMLAAPVVAIVFGCITMGLFTMRGSRRNAAVVALTAMAMLLPWVVRNREVLGGWFFVRDNFGLELRVSNADTALADSNRNAERGAMRQYHPLFNPEEVERIARYGELSEYARMRREAMAWILDHPQAFLELTGQHVRNFWMPIGTSRLQLATRWMCYSLGIFGLAALYARRRSDAGLMTIFLICYPLPYYFLQSYSRYAYPTDWAVVLLAIFGGHSIIRRLKQTPASKATAKAMAQAAAMHRVS